MSELRSYLFFFDIVVQNGGIPLKIIPDIQAELAAHPNWGEIERLQAILEVRLKLVKPEYVKDVRHRKESIIHGTGVVHGARRDYGREYCADLSTIVH